MFLVNAHELCQSSTLTRHRAQCIRNGIIGLNIFVAGKNGNAAAMWIAEQQENGSRFTKDLEHWKKKKERKNTDNEDHLREQMCIVPLRRAIAFEAAFTETQRKEEKRLDHDVAAQFVEAAMLCRTFDEIMSIEHNQDYGKSIATMNDDGTGFIELKPRSLCPHCVILEVRSSRSPARARLHQSPKESFPSWTQAQEDVQDSCCRERNR